MASVAQEFADGCAVGELRYQWDEQAQRAVFYPRVVAPGTGAPLTWRVSRGLGTVHSTTFVHQRDAEPRNLTLVDLDEGFRMMSLVEGVGPGQIAPGDRVSVRFDDTHRPVFVLAERER